MISLNPIKITSDDYEQDVRGWIYSADGFTAYSKVTDGFGILLEKQGNSNDGKPLVVFTDENGNTYDNINQMQENINKAFIKKLSTDSAMKAIETKKEISIVLDGIPLDQAIELLIKLRNEIPNESNPYLHLDYFEDDYGFEGHNTKIVY